MADIMDYMEWRGDVTFDMIPVNEVDGLIFSQFAYIPLEGVIDDMSGEMSVLEAGNRFFDIHSEEEIRGYTELLKNCCRVFKGMMNCDRFKNLKIKYYHADFDPEISKQFGAVTIVIHDDLYYVAFRGTDDSLAGWEEDFKACYTMPVEAQVEAESYLGRIFNDYDGKIYIGGHSKGGNLAVYAAMTEGYKHRDRVVRIHNFDGPGFLEEYVKTTEYQTMAKIVENYNPKASIVGMIMFRDDDCVIVESSEKGLMQHTGISWQVKGTHFVTADSFENFSMVFSQANKTWINGISEEERELFIEIVFRILRDGFDTVTGLKEGFFTTATAIIKSYNGIEKETRRMIRRIVGHVIKLSKESYFETRKMIKSSEEKGN